MADEDFRLLLGGLVAQLVSFVTFTVVYDLFLYHVGPKPNHLELGIR